MEEELNKINGLFIDPPTKSNINQTLQRTSIQYGKVSFQP